MSFKVPEKYRIQAIGYESQTGSPFGVFEIHFQNNVLLAIATDGKGVTGADQVEWEHVSVSLKNRVPNWKEMCFVKDLFWGEEDCVVQFHPPRSRYVNNHPFVLHLWRAGNRAVIMPPLIFV